MLFKQMLKEARSSWGMPINWAMHEKIDSCSLFQPEVYASAPFLQIFTIPLPLRMTDETHETKRSGHKRLERQLWFFALLTDLGIVRRIINRSSIKQNTTNPQLL